MSIADETPVDDVTVEVDDTSSDVDDTPSVVIEKWGPLVDGILKTTREAFNASPKYDPSEPLVYQTYWRDIFTLHRDAVSADNQISKYLTEPPVKDFTITLFDYEHGGCCPCCHPETDPNIKLRNPSGVTKEEFLDGFIECFYGVNPPRVWHEPYGARDDVGDEGEGEGEGAGEDTDTARTPDDISPDPEKVDTVSRDDDEGDTSSCEDTAEGKDLPNALVYTSSWMSSGGNSDRRIAYSPKPFIYMYCCGPKDYERKRRRREELEKSQVSNKEVPALD